MLARITIAVGLILSGVGLYGYFGTGMKSLTPLLPAIPALLILLCGLIALKKSKESNWIMTAQLLSFFTLVVCIPNIMKTSDVIAGTAERPIAVILALIFAAVIVIYLLVTLPIAMRRRPVAAVNSVLPIA